MPRPLVLLAAVCTLALAACDLVEVVPPDGPPVEPPPAQPVHPYGAGNGKVIFLSDLASAERIDVTLAGEAIGAVTKFVGCPSRVTADDSLATAIRPAGNYQYSARSTTGLLWATSSVRIDEDGLKRITFFGRPSDYALHLPDEIEGYPTGASNSISTFRYTVQDATVLRLIVQLRGSIQGDRFDVVSNGRVLARGTALGASDIEIAVPLVPGPNYLAMRLSTDVDGDGSPALTSLYDGAEYIGRLYDSRIDLRSTSWFGIDIRNAC